MTDDFTCQVCGRIIKANTGVIAHHGYQRPGEGWQTASCLGAREVAYEIGHDALDNWIVMLGDLVERTKVAIKSRKDNPPPQFTVGPKDGYGKRRWERIETKPEGFDGHAPSPGSFKPYTYQSEFYFGLHEMERNLRGMQYELKRSNERRATWKSPFRRDIPIPA